jgi:hypothetical protein
MKVTSTIDGLTEADFDRIRAGGAGERYEVVFDYADGDHHELELHFRLVEQYPTRPAEPVIRVEGVERDLPPGDYIGTVTRVGWLPGTNRPEITMALRDSQPDHRSLSERLEDRLAVRERSGEFYGGLGGSGPRMPARRTYNVSTARLAELLASMIELAHIGPAVLGIPGGDQPLAERIYNHLMGDDRMGKHGNGQAADSKDSKGGGAHEKGGSGKGGK